MYIHKICTFTASFSLLNIKNIHLHAFKKKYFRESQNSINRERGWKVRIFFSSLHLFSSPFWKTRGGGLSYANWPTMSSRFGSILTSGKSQDWMSYARQTELKIFSPCHIPKGGLKLSAPFFRKFYCTFEVLWQSSMSTAGAALR